MKINNLRKFVKIKQFLKFLCKAIVFSAEITFCGICVAYLISLLTVIIYETYHLMLENEAFKYYVFGILILISSVLSVMYISYFNKKYLKNDSNTSKRQNDFLFDEDIYKK